MSGQEAGLGGVFKLRSFVRCPSVSFKLTFNEFIPEFLFHL